MHFHQVNLISILIFTLIQFGISFDGKFALQKWLRISWNLILIIMKYTFEIKYRESVCALIAR